MAWIKCFILLPILWVRNSERSRQGRSCLGVRVLFSHVLLTLQKPGKGWMGKMLTHVAGSWGWRLQVTSLEYGGCQGGLASSLVVDFPVRSKLTKPGGSHKAVLTCRCVLVATSESLDWPRFKGEGKGHKPHLSMGSYVRRICRHILNSPMMVWFCIWNVRDEICWVLLFFKIPSTQCVLERAVFSQRDHSEREYRYRDFFF